MIKKISFLLIGLLFSASAFGACNPIMPMAGGLGACNDNSYIVNLGGAVNTQGSVTFSGLYPFTANLSEATSITFPTAGTLLSDAGSYSNPSWLTALDASKLTSGILPSLRLEGDYGGITGIGTIGNLTISNTGIVQGAISTSTSGSTNSATWLTSRGDQANGSAQVIYQTAGITNYIEGLFPNSNHYKIWDAINNVYPIDITPGTGTSSVVDINGGIRIENLSLASLVGTDGIRNLTSVNLSGDVSTSGLTSTLATVNSNVGSFGSASAVPVITVNGKGLVTAVSTAATVGSISGTANQITASASTGSVVLSTPQNIGTASSVQWGAENIGPTQTLPYTPKLAVTGTDSSATSGPSALFITGADQYPQFQILPYSHSNVSINFDAYNDGAAWKSSQATSNWQILKVNQGLVFNYASSVAQGGTITWTNSLSSDASAGGRWTFSSPVVVSALTANSLVASDGSKLLTSNISSISPTFSALTTTNDITANGNLIDNVAGKTLKIKQGANACSGSVTLSGSTTTVNTTCAATGDQVYVSARTTMGSAPGFISVSISNGTSLSFTSSTGASDNGTANFLIVKAS